MSDPTPIIEFVKDGRRYRIEGDRLYIRRGWTWIDSRVYRRMYGETEKADNVIEFRRVRDGR